MIQKLGGTGYMECHAVSSPYVELAEDGASARGLWYSIGQDTCPPPLPYATLDNHHTYTQCDCYAD